MHAHQIASLIPLRVHEMMNENAFSFELMIDDRIEYREYRVSSLRRAFSVIENVGRCGAA